MDIIRKSDVIENVGKIIEKEELREEIITKYVAPEDIAIITEWCKKQNICISFREAGTATIRCLQSGAGAKPHTILDKTIKNPAEKEAVRRFLNMFPEDMRSNIEGLVGHWIGNQEIDGIYLTANGKEYFEKDFQLGYKNEMPYLMIDENTPEKLKERYDELVQEKDKPYDFMRLFYTGDYDAHDLLQCDKPVVSADSDKPGAVSGGDAGHLLSLQTALYNNRIDYIDQSGVVCRENKIETLETADEKKKTDFHSYRHVQHGPQCNYIAQMKNDNHAIKDAILKKNFDTKNVEKINLISNLVAAMSHPVVCCDKGDWGILRETKDIVRFYEKKGITVKPAWKDGGEIEKWKTDIRNCILICYIHEFNGMSFAALDDLVEEVQKRLWEAPADIEEYVGGEKAIREFLETDITKQVKSAFEPGGNRFVVYKQDTKKYYVKSGHYGDMSF